MNEEQAIVKKASQDECFESYETVVASVEQAVELARKWQIEGKFDVFRGQGRKWNIKASIHRVKSQKAYRKHLKRLELLFLFMSDNPVLKNYTQKPDEVIAIAQHYGIATNFVDFTSDPSIAAYFATHSSANKIGEHSCIICANVKDFHDFLDFVTPVIKQYYPNGHSPEFLYFNIDNLWRLQAQKGQFLYLPFDGIEKYYRFNRILFPFDGPFKKVASGNIYPKEKSTLETHLDYFFNSEYRSDNMNRILKRIGEDNVRHLPKHNIFDYINKNCTAHYSWRRHYINDWYITVRERWDDIANNKALLISLPYNTISKKEVDTITKVIEKTLHDNVNCRDLLSKITVQRVKLSFNKRMHFQVNRGATLIWNGMRKLPYTNKEIARALGRFIIMVYFNKDYKDDREFKPLMGRTVYIGLASGDGSNTKSHVSGLTVLKSKRRNILKYINDEFKDICLNNPVALIQLITKPTYLFTFEGFRELFVLDVIPSQTVLTINDDHPIIYFNPVFIETFGLA